MADKMTPSERSKVMRAIRGKDTKPEIYVRKALHSSGFRFRIHQENLLGKPDIVLSRYRIAIFINGCFWHGHDCKKGKRPSSNEEFWEKKLNGNIQRDRNNIEALNMRGWEVITIWQCSLKRGTEGLLNRLKSLKKKIFQ